jgi:hypothetical protein
MMLVMARSEEYLQQLVAIILTFSLLYRRGCCR